jgi:hypothetical protein
MVSRVDALAKAAQVVGLPERSFTRPITLETMAARLRASL